MQGGFQEEGKGSRQSSCRCHCRRLRARRGVKADGSNGVVEEGARGSGFRASLMASHPGGMNVWMIPWPSYARGWSPSGVAPPSPHPRAVQSIPEPRSTRAPTGGCRRPVREWRDRVAGQSPRAVPRTHPSRRRLLQLSIFQVGNRVLSYERKLIFSLFRSKG